MNILIVDDDFVSRKKMNLIMSRYGRCDTAARGDECMYAFIWEESHGVPFGNAVKIIMVTVKWDSQTLLSSFKEGCEAYAVKPFDQDKIEKAMKIPGFSI